MPIDLEFRHDGAGFIAQCHGALTITDFVDVQNSLLASPDMLRKLRYGIMDLTSVETLNLNYEKMVSIVEGDKRLAVVTPPGTLVAIVSPKDLGYGLGRMWEALVDQFGWETMTFRFSVEAEHWIQQRAKEKFGIVLAEGLFHP